MRVDLQATGSRVGEGTFTLGGSKFVIYGVKAKELDAVHVG